MSMQVTFMLQNYVLAFEKCGILQNRMEEIANTGRIMQKNGNKNVIILAKGLAFLHRICYNGDKLLCERSVACDETYD